MRLEGAQYAKRLEKASFFKLSASGANELGMFLEESEDWCGQNLDLEGEGE